MAPTDNQRVERIHATAVVRALLTAIFFHRRLDNLEPTTLDVLDTHVAAGLDPELEREVESKVEEFGEIVDSGADSGEVSAARRHCAGCCNRTSQPASQLASHVVWFSDTNPRSPSSSYNARTARGGLQSPRRSSRGKSTS